MPTCLPLNLHFEIQPDESWSWYLFLFAQPQSTSSAHSPLQHYHALAWSPLLSFAVSTKSSFHAIKLQESLPQQQQQQLSVGGKEGNHSIKPDGESKGEINKRKKQNNWEPNSQEENLINLLWKPKEKSNIAFYFCMQWNTNIEWLSIFTHCCLQMQKQRVEKCAHKYGAAARTEVYSSRLNNEAQLFLYGGKGGAVIG